MRIAIVGAGFAGLTAAKVLKHLGHDVTVYEKAPDIGGVWSATRRYLGLKTQNDKSTYCFSDLPMPPEYPEWPSGEQVQAYLEAYVDKFGLNQQIHSSSEVTHAEPVDGGGWNVTTAKSTEYVEHLVLANGVFSQPHIPPFVGTDVVEDLGGQIMPPSDLHNADQIRDKHVLIVGYGKSACDIAVEVAVTAKSTNVVARELLWKMPRRIGRLNFKYLMLTRFGEALFRYHSSAGVEKLLHARKSALANGILKTLGQTTTKQLNLAALGLIPDGTFADIANSTVSLASEGFFEGVGSGDIRVHRDCSVSRFLERNGRLHVELTSGEVIPNDVVIAATGWSQDIPFLPKNVIDRLIDDNGDFLLYHHILPINVPDLTFAGYNSSLFSPLSAEVSAIWIGSYLARHHNVPSTKDMLDKTHAHLAWMRMRTGGKHARSTNVIPFSMHNIDELLTEIGIDVPRTTKVKQWLLPIKPGDYKDIAPALAQEIRNHAL